MRLLLLILVGVVVGCHASFLRRHQARVINTTTEMILLELPAGSPWRPLLSSVAPYLLLEAWGESSLDDGQVRQALAQLIANFELRPGVLGKDQDLCHSLARSARNVMRVRAMDKGQTRARLATIRARVDLVETVCRRTIPAPNQPLTDAEDQAFRDALFLYQNERYQ